MSATVSLESHYSNVVKALRKDKLVFLLGAGVNLCDPARDGWEMGENLPGGRELSRYIADECRYPGEDRDNLLRVAQYAAAERTVGALYEDLHDVFAAAYGYTSVHSFLARLPALAGRTIGRPVHPLIVTTNYDDALEQAMDRALEPPEPYDLLWYCVPGKNTPGRLYHRPPEGEPTPIEVAKKYEASLGERVAILKIHGAVSRNGTTRESYVISEDHYIDFMAESSLQELIPPALLSRLLNSHILFLGYSLQDWNLRVILQQIANQQDFQLDYWAVQRGVSKIDKVLWGKREVRLYDADLGAYVAGLERYLIETASRE